MMRKKKQVTIKKRLTASVMAGIMAFSVLAGLQTSALTVKAADYGLANPRLDKKNHTVVYDCVYFGNYWQEDTNGDGKADKKDNKTPIKWRVLSVNGDDAFLIADQNLDMQTYNDTYKDEDGNYLDITWEKCTMRSWLNGYGADSNICKKDYTGAGSSFINNAFSASEKTAIQSTVLVNNELNYGTESGNDTTDKIFLLSVEDIANEAYGFSNYRNKTGENDKDWYGEHVGIEPYTLYDVGEGKEVNKYYNISDYAKLRTNTVFAKGSDTASGKTYTSEIGTGCWRLRSPGTYVGDAWDLHVSGVIFHLHNYWYDFNDAYYAVCPALHLNLSSSDVWKPAGTVTCKPGNVGGIASGDGKQKKIAQPTVSKVYKFKATAKKKSLKLTWKKVKDADGYQIACSAKSNFKGAKAKNIAKGKTAYMVSKLKAKKKYYVRIRAYKNYKDASGKSCKAYGKWVKLSKKTK